MYKSVQRQNYRSVPPGNAVLLETLKTAEIQLQKREIIARPEAESFNPVWFLAETERNVFLWRAGYSLIDEAEFEFWIDIEALIEKRLKQIESGSGDNPFLNPLWGSNAFYGPENLAREKEYLIEFRDVLGRIQDHASALSHVTSQLRKELISDCSQEIVVLPGVRSGGER